MEKSETTRVEYRAIALDPTPDIRQVDTTDDFYGEIAPTAHRAHLNLEQSWVIDGREVVLERREVTETPWEPVSNA